MPQLEPSAHQALVGTCRFFFAGCRNNKGIRAGAFGGSIYLTGSNNYCIPKDRGLYERVLLCCMLACLLISIGVWAMSEACWWNISIHPWMGRDLLTVTGCSLVRDSTCRSAAYTASYCCAIRVLSGKLPPSISGTKNLRDTVSFCCFFP